MLPCLFVNLPARQEKRPDKPARSSRLQSFDWCLKQPAIPNRGFLSCRRRLSKLHRYEFQFRDIHSRVGRPSPHQKALPPPKQYRLKLNSWKTPTPLVAVEALENRTRSTVALRDDKLAKETAGVK